MTTQVTPAPNLPEPYGDHERTDVSARGIVWSGLALGVATLAIILLMRGLFAELARRADSRDAVPSSLAQTDTVPPRPRLQAAPQQDLAAFRKQEQHQLETYGWIDKPQKIVRIPVTRAMDLLLERGLPKTNAPKPAPPAGPESKEEK